MPDLELTRAIEDAENALIQDSVAHRDPYIGPHQARIAVEASAAAVGAQYLRAAAEHMADPTDAAWLKSYADELDGQSAHMVGEEFPAEGEVP